MSLQSGCRQSADSSAGGLLYDSPHLQPCQVECFGTCISFSVKLACHGMLTKLLYIAGVSAHEHARRPLPTHQYLPCQLSSRLAPSKNVWKAQHPLQVSAVRFRLALKPVLQHKQGTHRVMRPARMSARHSTQCNPVPLLQAWALKPECVHATTVRDAEARLPSRVLFPLPLGPICAAKSCHAVQEVSRECLR